MPKLKIIFLILFLCIFTSFSFKSNYKNNYFRSKNIFSNQKLSDKFEEELDYSCKCLMRYYGELQFRTYKKVIKHCFRKQHIKPEVFDYFKDIFNLKNKYKHKLFKCLFSSWATIYDYQATQDANLDSESLVNFLTAAKNSNQEYFPDFSQDLVLKHTSNPKDLSSNLSNSSSNLINISGSLTNSLTKNISFKVKNILADEVGFSAVSLYSLEADFGDYNKKYIIKESIHDLKECISLELIKRFFVKNNFKFNYEFEPNLPTISLSLANFSYTYIKDLKGSKKLKKRYFTILPQASGCLLSTLISEFRDNPNENNQARISKAFRQLGVELSNFHRRFMISNNFTNSLSPNNSKDLSLESKQILCETVVHGDLHYFNIIYDEQNNHFTFIDNETMCRSLKTKKSPAYDLLRLIFNPFEANETLKKFSDLVVGIDLKLWFQISFKNFIEGYISVYSKSNLDSKDIFKNRFESGFESISKNNKIIKKVLNELKIFFNTNNSSIFWLSSFQRERLDEIRQNYLAPIFLEILDGY